MTPPFDRRGFYLALGRRIRAARDVKGMTQASLAHESGYSSVTISKIECAHTNTDLATVLAIAEVLDEHPKVLLFGPEESECPATLKSL